MIEEYGNIWSLPGDAICITTNGIVKSNGEAVMGAGIAKEAKEEYPGIDKHLGSLIKEFGNHVFPLWHDPISNQIILSFPTKHNWWEKSDMELIRQSCRELMFFLAGAKSVKTVLLPRPGVGAGKLKWEDVKREIEPILDNRVSVVTFYKS